MIQDIFPSRLDNSFKQKNISSDDVLICFDNEGRLLVSVNDGSISFLKGSDSAENKNIYAFSIDDSSYYISISSAENNYTSYEYMTLRQLRDCGRGKELFAAFTAYHLWKWYSDNNYCGRCSEKLVLHETERALVCTKCGNVIYPRINPAVIVGVTKGDSILITRYRRGFAHNALVAGFTEIGETLEETVRREVMEETGVKVKNIRYYKSQPWGMAQDMLAGFFCEADGDGEIHMDENELKYAEWVKREDIVLQPNDLSLTNEMMKLFKDGNE